MARRPNKILQSLPKTRDAQLIPALALHSITSRSGMGVYASSDLLYKSALFGRDSLEVADDLLLIRPKLVRAILLTMVRLQGARNNPLNEEEPGKIVHEYRASVMDGRPIDKNSLKILQSLSSKWGGSEHELRYYGSVDSTPLFVTVLEKYCRYYGAEILRTSIITHSNETTTVLAAVTKAIDWIILRLHTSHSGLVEFQRLNPHGIMNQVWKDSDEAYTHTNKTPANHSAPISSIEVQGLCYDALLAGARLLPQRQDELIRYAQQLQARVLDTLWMAKENYFALGTDYDEQQRLRLIKTPMANAGALLYTSLFDGLPEEQKITYIDGITTRLCSPDFLTDAGVRSRALSASKLVDHWDYHGSYVSWPKETYDIAKGLAQQGFPLIARQLENRILNVCLKYRAYPEFVYVDSHGRVFASAPSSKTHGELNIVHGTNQPERIQAWTTSAVIAITTARLKNKLRPKRQLSRQPWQVQLEAKILTQIPDIHRHLNPKLLNARYPTYPYTLKDN